MLISRVEGMRSEARSFVTLDGLRGVAALVVVIGHAQPFGFTQFPQFDLAVDFFFALSGFVLTHAYAERLRKGMSPKAFVTLRIIRLYPLYILGTVLGMLVWLPARHGLGSRAFCVEVIAAALFLPSPVSGQLYPLNFPAWSLFFELVANCALAILNNRLSRTLLCALVTIAAAALIAYAYWSGTFSGGAKWFRFEGGIARVSFSFFAGVLVYRLWLKRPARPNLPAAIPAAILVAILGFPIGKSLAVTYDLSMICLAFPLLLWLGASSHPTRPIAAICSWMGAVSYAVYALHAPILGAAGQLHIPRTLPWGIALLAAIVFAADVATRFFDRPVRRRLTAWFGVDARPASRLVQPAP